VIQTYRNIREALLVAPVKGAGADETKLSEIAGLMRALSGHYDQAARSAASL
jgi:predicted MarR family transcription regulator